MINKSFNMKRGSGFSLIEALIALAVFSFGILAIAKFQASIIADSSYSKARSEAVQLAQQKLDELRSYSTEPQLVAQLMDAAVVNTNVFPTNVTSATYPTPGDTIYGVNAKFTRQWGVACDTANCRVTVNVTWVDPVAGSQTAGLESSVTWRNPRGMVDLETNDNEPAVPSATGRAYLGDGTVTQAQMDAGTSNNDGTTTIQRINNGEDVVLVDNTANDDGTYDIILTLEDACVSQDNSCTDFVEISGKIYIENGLATDSLWVLASDAAYCARIFATPIATTSPNGDYTYFDYTCYLGGGWHGNIGLLIDANENQRRVCLGDPSSPNIDDADDTNNWRQMELASRRVYRGMTIRSDVVSIDADTLFYSHGIKDDTTLPDPNWAARYYGHDFVVTTINGQQISGEDCADALTQPDAVAGNLFYGVPTDFLCLNEDNNPTGSDYLDTIDTGYRDPGYCPYDPSRGPADANIISGTVTVSGGATIGSSYMWTSASAQNCWFYETQTINGLTANVPIDASGMTSAPYECIVYSWDGEGWSGYVGIIPDTSLACTSTVVPGETQLPYGNPPDGDPTTLTQNVTGQNYTCQPKLTPVISGTLTAYMNNLSTMVDADVVAVRTNADTSTLETPCTVNVTSDSDLLSNTVTTDDAYFECNVTEETLAGGWVGKVTVTLPSGIVCDLGSWTSNSPDLVKEWTTGSPLTSEAVDLSTHCSGPQTTLRVSGVMTDVNTLTGATLPTVTADGLACSTNDGTVPVRLNADTGYVEYNCDVAFDTQNGWGGTITIADPTDGTMACAGDLSWSPASALTTNATSPALVQCGTTDRVNVDGTLTIVYPHSSIFCVDNLGDLRCVDWTIPTDVTVTMESSNPAVINGTCKNVPSDKDGGMTATEQVDGTILYSGATATTPKNVVLKFTCGVQIPWNKTWAGDITYTVSPADAYWAYDTSSPVPKTAPGGNSILVNDTVDDVP